MNETSTRARALYAIRTNLGWSAADAAKKLDVTPRMLGLWETGAKEIPDGRWRLFVHEMKAELSCNPSVVVVLDAEGNTPIDSVSEVNFRKLEVLGDGTAVISSFAVDRITQRPYIHSQRFLQKFNEHVLRIAGEWELNLRTGASAKDKELLAVNRWLISRAVKAEEKNPRLQALKANIAAAEEELALAKDEKSRRNCADKFDRAVLEFIQAIAPEKEPH